MREYLKLYLILCLFLAALVNVVLLFYFLGKMTHNRKEGVPYYPGDGQSPNNIMDRAHQLTDKGLKARKNYYICQRILWCTIAGLILIQLLL